MMASPPRTGPGLSLIQSAFLDSIRCRLTGRIAELFIIRWYVQGRTA